PDSREKWDESPAMGHWEDLAWQVQDDTERVLLARAKWLRQKTNAKNLCIAGGVALNCVANGRTLRESAFDNIFIQPAAGDDGIAIGCAYYGHLAVLKKPRSFVMRHAYLGRNYASEEVRAAVAKRLIRISTVRTESADICRDAARALSEDKVVGWF